MKQGIKDSYEVLQEEFKYQGIQSESMIICSEVMDDGATMPPTATQSKGKEETKGETVVVA